MCCRAAFVLVLAPLLAGCPDDDAAVFVEATVADPNVAVEAGTLGATLTGSFRLRLHLGPRASGPSDVGVGAFSLLSDDRQTTLVSPLPVSADRAFPVTVEPGGDEIVVFTIDSGSNLIPEAEREAICASGGLVIDGVVEDSLQDGSTPAASPVFIPDGC